ncbi:MAG: hypothetical protein GY749_06835 [Desulfobacteraceae bacterium]|nr:hypothetical protein [Desulfobacteraceae bacterium]
MFLLNHIKPEEATGKVAEIYGAFPKEIGVPKPLQMMSASPELLERQFESIKYFTSHKNLSFPLLASIRYIGATECTYDYCASLNGGILKAQGMTDDELEAMKNDPDKAPLEDKEREMLKFVLKAIRTPENVGEADVEQLHSAGWSDSDIYDAVAHGANLAGYSILSKALSK